MADWHDLTCRRLDPRSFNGIVSCMSCGSIGPDIKPIEDSSVSRAITTYQPIEGKTEFRILILEPGVFDDPLECHLSCVSTADAPDYRAISHTWTDETGDATKSRTVRLNKQPFLITKNCGAAMKRVRHRHGQRNIWVDAICIDQDNDLEKGHQVRLMPQIYSRAREVLVYIGEFQDAQE